SSSVNGKEITLDRLPWPSKRFADPAGSWAGPPPSPPLLHALALRQQILEATALDRDEQPLRLGRELAGCPDPRLREDLAAFDAHELPLEAQLRVEWGRPPILDREAGGHAGVSPERLHVAEHLVEGRGDEAAVHAARRPLVGGAEGHRGHRATRPRAADRDRGRQRIGEPDHRALVEEGADVAGIGRLRVAVEVLEPRVGAQRLGVALEALGGPARAALRGTTRPITSRIARARRRFCSQAPCPETLVASQGEATLGVPARSSATISSVRRSGPGPSIALPAVRSEAQPGTVLARLHLFVGALVAGRADLPLASDLHVLVGVEGGTADRDLRVRLDDGVLERPHARRAGGTGELDLGMVDAVAGQEARGAHRLLQEPHDRVATLEGVTSPAVGRAGVLGEALGELVPALLVETAQVLVLEALDRLDLLQVDHGRLLRVAAF